MRKLAAIIFLASGLVAFGLTNGFNKPYLGWNDYYWYHQDVSATMVSNVAWIMHTNGMQAAGYQYVNLDDYWSDGTTNGLGVPNADAAKFPAGIGPVADYVHSLGLKFGIYFASYPSGTSEIHCGIGNCWTNAVNWAASIGVDFIKYDYASSQSDTEKMLGAVLGCGRPMVFNIQAFPVTPWQVTDSNASRTSNDSSSEWGDMLVRADDFNTAVGSGYIATGFWPDADYLQIEVYQIPGLTNMNETEYRSQFALWCVLGTPIMMSNAMTNMAASTLALITQPELIAINQDALLAPGTRRGRTAGFGGNMDVWVKPLTNGVAVAVVNGTGGTTNVTVDFSGFGLGNRVFVRDAFARADVGLATNTLTVTNLVSHDTAVLLLVTNRESSSTVHYVDVAATGANNGTSWADAWTSLFSAYQYAGNVQPGDSVFVKGGDYWMDREIYRGNYTYQYDAMPGSLRLTSGTSNNWVYYYATNGVSKFYCKFVLQSFTSVYGGLTNGYETNVLWAYDTPKITNNCGFWIYRYTNYYDAGSGGRSMEVYSYPVNIEWVRMTGCTNIDPAGGLPGYGSYTNKSDSANELYFGETAQVGTESSNNVGYVWIDMSSGHGAGAAIAAGSIGTNFNAFNVHHCLLENNGSDIFNHGGGCTFAYNMVRNRYGAGSGGCNDTFEIGGTVTHELIHHNVMEPADNTVLYAGGAKTTNLHDFYFYDNVLVRPPADRRVQQYQGQGVLEQDVPDPPGDYHYYSNVVFACNTWLGGTNDYDSAFVDVLSKAGLPYNFIVHSNAIHIMNNLSYWVEPYSWNQVPLSLHVGSNVGGGTNNVGAGWTYDTNSIQVDYNQFWGASDAIMTWGDTAYIQSHGGPAYLTNAAQIASLLGYTHNVSDVPVTLADPANNDLRPTSAAVNVGQNLSAWKSLMPDIDKDIYGVQRSTNGGAWSTGAIEYQDTGLLLWLTFDAADWVTNGGSLVVADHSGWTNNAIGFDFTGWAGGCIWPAPTNGPAVLNGARFSVPYSDGSFGYGTYLGITNLYGLLAMTNGTWALWCADEQGAAGGYDAFLNCGYSGTNNWKFGLYYDSGGSPIFARLNDVSGDANNQVVAKWPDVTGVADWKHYAITWDGTNFVAYLNGTAYSTNGPGATNTYTGILSVSNVVNTDVAHQWLSIGVATHSGTYLRTDGDGLPNNGSLVGRLADVRIYNRALSATEVQAIYASGTTNEAPPVATGVFPWWKAPTMF